MRKLYRCLRGAYGDQHWWPIMHSRTLHFEYRSRRRLTAPQRFEIACGAVLTQNTNWMPNTVRALAQIRLGRELTNAEQCAVLGNTEVGRPVDRSAPPLTPETILSLSPARLSTLIMPARYYNQKAVYLYELALFFQKLGRSTPERSELLRVRGVGRETADSILVYAFGRPHFIVDAYTRRIFSAHGFIGGEEAYDVIKEIAETRLRPDLTLCSEYHALLVEHAQRYYRKKPYGTGDPFLPRR